MPEPVIAYATLFGWSFLAATILPLGSEPALFAMVARGHSVSAAVAVATAGNYLGACTTYWVGRARRQRDWRRGTVHPSARRDARRARW